MKSLQIINLPGVKGEWKVVGLESDIPERGWGDTACHALPFRMPQPSRLVPVDRREMLFATVLAQGHCACATTCGMGSCR